MSITMLIFKKELKRFFTDKRMLAGIILPGILIFVIYTLMGHFINKMNEVEKDYHVYVLNLPEGLKPFFDEESDSFMNFYLPKEPLTKEEALKKVKEKDLAGYVVFDKDFMEKLVLKDPNNLPNVKVYFNSSDMQSASFYQIFTSLLQIYEEPNFTLNKGEGELFDLATKEDQSMLMLSSMLPMLLVAFLFGPLMGICSESIAGEKERGTFATLLITPASRFDIAMGKILALGLTGLTSSVISFIGLMGALPNLLPKDTITTSMYGVGTYVLMFLVMLVTVLLITVLLTIVSTYAKSVKEASTLATPIMMISLILGIFGMGRDTPILNHGVYAIPILNSLQSFTALLQNNINTTNLIITILSNACFIGLGIVVLGKMFNSEKIMFNK